MNTGMTDYLDIHFLYNSSLSQWLSGCKAPRCRVLRCGRIQWRYLRSHFHYFKPPSNIAQIVPFSGVHFVGSPKVLATLETSSELGSMAWIATHWFNPNPNPNPNCLKTVRLHIPLQAKTFPVNPFLHEQL